MLHSSEVGIVRSPDLSADDLDQYPETGSPASMRSLFGDWFKDMALLAYELEIDEPPEVLYEGLFSDVEEKGEEERSEVDWSVVSPLPPDEDIVSFESHNSNKTISCTTWGVFSAVTQRLLYSIVAQLSN